jgi:hypothetical protein
MTVVGILYHHPRLVEIVFHFALLVRPDVLKRPAGVKSARWMPKTDELRNV